MQNNINSNNTILKLNNLIKYKIKLHRILIITYRNGINLQKLKRKIINIKYVSGISIYKLIIFVLVDDI